MTTTTSITVMFTAPGFHRWPDAEGEQTFLAYPHRHLFYVTLSLTVFHNDREVEFHAFLNTARSRWVEQLGAQSCEDVARTYSDWMQREYPDRWYQVSVFEDNEVGATVTVTPTDD